jgi:hypothetical protein
MAAGIENARMLDVVTTNDQEIILVMVAAQPWTDDRVFDVQLKVKTYLTYIDSGQLLKDFPEAVGRTIRVQLDTVHPLSPLAKRFIGIAENDWLRPIGVTFSVVELPA